MSKTKLFSALILIVGLVGLSLYLNRDYFAPSTIQVAHRISPWLRGPQKPGRRANDLGTPVTFTLNGYFRLKSIQVLIAAEAQTNKFAHPIWNLVSDSNSAPTASFAYGQNIRGMRLAVKGVPPDPLETNITYRLVIATDKAKNVQHDFSVSEN